MASSNSIDALPRLPHPINDQLRVILAAGKLTHANLR